MRITPVVAQTPLRVNAMTAIHIVRGRSRDIGFTVRRLLPTLDYPAVGPFVFLDHMGPAQFPAGSTEGDVRPHPHIGLATVTFLYSGAFMHRDSLGSVQRIEPGAVNWMRAGHGVVHSERIPDDVRVQQLAVEGIQMWLALPQAQEQSAPEFVHYPAAQLPVIRTAHTELRVLIGRVNEQQSPVQTPAPTLFADVQLQAGAAFTVQADYSERALYVSQGELFIGEQRVVMGELAIVPAGHALSLRSSTGARAMLLGGEPLDGKRFLWWNFVASDKALIEAAKTRWQNETFPPVPGESERIPLPER